MGPEKHQPVFTCRPVMSDGVPMARVTLEVGQYSFQAGCEYRDPENPSHPNFGNNAPDFPEACRRVMSAITLHAESKGWL